MDVIKWERNGMVGNYYDPYRIDYEDALYELERDYDGLFRGFTRKAYLIELNKLEKGELIWQ